MLFKASGVPTRSKYDATIHPDMALGLFIRELVGLDRAAAKLAFAGFLDESSFNSQQIQFVTTIIDYLAQNGVMEPKTLFAAPFSDLHVDGAGGVFSDTQVIDLVKRLQNIRFKAEEPLAEKMYSEAAEEMSDFS